MENKSTLCHQLIVGLVIGMVIAGVAGCGHDDRIAVHPAAGEVFVDGQPAAGVALQFCPVDEATIAASIFPSAKTDHLGRYVLSTYKPGDGIPAGQYKVTASWKSLDTTDPEEMHADELTAAEEKLDAKFLDAELTPLTIEIAEGTNELAAFNLEILDVRKRKRQRRRKP